MKKKSYYDNYISKQHENLLASKRKMRYGKNIKSSKNAITILNYKHDKKVNTIRKRKMEMDSVFIRNIVYPELFN